MADIDPGLVRTARSPAPAFHVGVIMDGNGRWAAAKGLGRLAGHARGARRATEIVYACPDLGVTHLTLFAFSTENWRRPAAEVDGLMRIFRRYILSQMEGLRRHDVRVRFLGMRHRRAAAPARADGMPGGEDPRLQRAQPVDRHRLRRPRRADPGGAGAVAAGRGRHAAAGRRSRRGLIEAALDTRELPDPDFIIRTSGELRISNFLLWQGAYAEYGFLDTAWPDFTVDRFAEALAAYHQRRRRFGGADPPPQAAARH